jgi:hypothetical protein
MAELWEHASMTWCRLFHSGTRWPVHGHYHCPVCLRIYPVTWEETLGSSGTRRDKQQKNSTSTAVGESPPREGICLEAAAHGSSQCRRLLSSIVREQIMRLKTKSHFRNESWRLRIAERLVVVVLSALLVSEVYLAIKWWLSQ